MALKLAQTNCNRDVFARPEAYNSERNPQGGRDPNKASANNKNSKRIGQSKIEQQVDVSADSFERDRCRR